MKFHPHVVHELLQVIANHGGYKNETKLRRAFANVRLSPYQLSSTGETYLVNTQKLVSERLTRKIPVNDVVPIKLHGSLVEKLLKTYDIYGGYAFEAKIKKALEELDLTIYEQKSVGDHVLVLTEDYMKVLQGTVNL